MEKIVSFTNHNNERMSYTFTEAVKALRDVSYIAVTEALHAGNAAVADLRKRLVNLDPGGKKMALEELSLLGGVDLAADYGTDPAVIILERGYVDNDFRKLFSLECLLRYFDVSLEVVASSEQFDWTLSTRTNIDNDILQIHHFDNATYTGRLEISQLGACAIIAPEVQAVLSDTYLGEVRSSKFLSDLMEYALGVDVRNRVTFTGDSHRALKGALWFFYHGRGYNELDAEDTFLFNNSDATLAGLGIQRKVRDRQPEQYHKMVNAVYGLYRTVHAHAFRSVMIQFLNDPTDLYKHLENLREAGRAMAANGGKESEIN